MGNKSEFKEIVCVFDILFVYMCIIFVVWWFNYVVVEICGNLYRMCECVYYSVLQQVYIFYRKIIMLENGIYNIISDCMWIFIIGLVRLVFIKLVFKEQK